MHPTLISVQLLAENLEHFRLLDCRARLGDLDFGRRAFAAGHLPGALHADLDRDFAAAPGIGGRHPLPNPRTLAATARRWGINDDTQIVVYDDAGGAFAARAWWCLRWLGHQAVAVLDGGIAAWPGKLSQVVAEYPPGNFTIRPSLTRTVDADTLLGMISEQPARKDAVSLLDARTEIRFNGEDEPIDPIAGHIPGARCMPFQDNLDADGRFKPPAELAQRFGALPQDTICYCGSGVTAAHNILAMVHAGYPEPILYPGSWSEWISDSSRPRSPSPIKRRTE